ncbi:MAG: ubiquitin-activating E1 FCCH domain-containing protein, partial [Thermodesulfovibrionales bacterium]|nr:ubiquitin-activating E1 FCCH domain-containing protein [Thermodesulfovibrionales bacterium]
VGSATCTAQSKTAGTTLTCTVATENLDEGNIAILWFAGDNTAAVNGNDGLLSSVTDSAGNSWTVQRCFTNAQGKAEAGATTCIATSKLAITLKSGSGTITATFASITAKAMVVREFTIGAGNTIAVVGAPQDLANNGSDPGSMTISGLANSEHLFVRSTALERASGGTWTVTAGYTTSECNGTTGAGGASNMETCGEFRILTATTSTSDPTASAVDNASIFIAFDEVPTVGPPNKLAFLQKPTNTIYNQTITPAVTVEIQDINGNRVTTATNTVTIAIGANPAGGTLSGTLSVSAVAGVATFSNLSINNVGNDYTLTASASGLTGATSEEFNITTGAYGLTQCAGSRYGSKLGCTANDVSITNITIVTPLTSCIGGEDIIVDLDLTINVGGPARYDIGIFIANDGLNPQIIPANGGSGSCSVAILPFTPNPFRNLDNDVCGDIAKPPDSGVLRMTDVTISCKALSGSGGNLYIPFVVSWDIQTTNTCSSIANPVPSTTSKCNAPTVLQGTVSVVVLPTITKTDNKTTLSPGESTTYTVVISNATGVTLTNALFKDPAVTGLSVPANGVTCSTTGGATCPVSCAPNCSVTDMQGAGLTIPSMPDNTAQSITGITKANPAVVTYSGADTYLNGDKVKISAVIGMTEVNDREFTVANVNTVANTFELSGINSADYTAYSSGGTVKEISAVTFTINATVSSNPPATFTNTATVIVADPAATPVADRTASASDTVGGSGSGGSDSRVRVIKWREVFQ